MTADSVTLVLCPRCRENFYMPYGEGDGLGNFVKEGVLPPYPALSRLSRKPGDPELWVCSPCGQEEGMLEYTAGRVIPTDQWPLTRRGEDNG